MLKLPLQIAAAALSVLLAGWALADPPNYQRYVIGERSLGMAGAYTAAVDDSMAIYYNPGALVFADTTAVSASKSVYAADHRTIKNGFIPNFAESQDAVDLDTSNDLSWPSTLTFMTTFGKKRKKSFTVKHSLAFAMLVPYQEDYSFRGKRHEGSGVADNQTFFLSESYKTLWTGLAYSIRPHRKLGLGLAGFWSNARYSRRYDTNYFNPPVDTSVCADIGCGELEFVESLLKTNTNSIIFRVGALVTPNDRWRLGLSVTPPSILIPKLSDGHLDQTRGLSSTTDPTATHSRLYTDDYKLSVTTLRPTSIRAGVAYTLPLTFTVDLDAEFFFPTSYRRIIGDPVATRLENDPEASPEWFDPGVVKKIERSAVVNLNLGAEIIMPRGWTVRTGLFSDFSSAPEVTPRDTPQLTKVHRIGGTFSLGHKGEDHDITVGVIGTYGSGTASVYQPELARGADEAAFQPEDYSERSIFVFISGVQKALERKTKELWKKVVD